jgi:hypothetical protein
MRGLDAMRIDLGLLIHLPNFVPFTVAMDVTLRGQPVQAINNIEAVS